jgi:predicted small lipoprotein YifL
MKSIILTGWRPLRMLRLATGIAGIGFGLANHDWLLGIAGIMLLLMALFNLANCGLGGCSITPNIETPKSVKPETENIDYQEVAKF